MICTSKTFKNALKRINDSLKTNNSSTFMLKIFNRRHNQTFEHTAQDRMGNQVTLEGRIHIYMLHECKFIRPIGTCITCPN